MRPFDFAQARLALQFQERGRSRRFSLTPRFSAVIFSSSAGKNRLNGFPLPSSSMHLAEARC